jgi:AraC family transcriptional regulator, transcriptional activator FtrA
MPIPRNPRLNPLVVAVTYDGLSLFAFACATEIFGLERPEVGPGWYRFATCSPTGRPVRGEYGIRMAVDGGLELLAKAGTVIIPGWHDIEAPVPPALVRALRSAHQRGARLLSICSGSVVLAATGLLDGRRMTTHWRFAAQVQRRFPLTQVDPHVLYIDDGSLLTSAGSASGLDLCIHLVRRDFGSAVANQVARRLIIPPHREGGQAQFVERPIDRREQGSLSAMLEHLQRNLHEPTTNARLSRQAAMSERTFIRRFRAATGMTPADWLTRARIDRVRELLESTTLPIDEIVARTGLGTPSTLRHHFRRRLGLSPVAYRRQFSIPTREGDGNSVGFNRNHR